MLLNYMKAYVSMYSLHLMLTFSPKIDVMVNGRYMYEHGGVTSLDSQFSAYLS